MREERIAAPGGIEYMALAALTLGAFIGSIYLPLSASRSIIGLALCGAGIALLWTSRVWDTKDKLLGTALLPIGFWAVELIHMLERATSPSEFELMVHQGLEIFIIATDIFVSLATLGWLLFRLRQQTQVNRLDDRAI